MQDVQIYLGGGGETLAVAQEPGWNWGNFLGAPVPELQKVVGNVAALCSLL